MVTKRLEPLSLLDYDGGSLTVRLHDVLRSYLYASLPDRAELHPSAAPTRWTDRPPSGEATLGAGWPFTALRPPCAVSSRSATR